MGLTEFFPIIGSYISSPYLKAFLVLIILLVLIRTLLGIFQKIFIKLTAKTQTKIDDLLIQKSSAPLTLMAFFISLRIAMGEIALSEALTANIASGIYSALVIVIGYWIYVIIDIVLIEGWKQIASKSKSKVDDTLVDLIHGVLRFALIALAFLYILDLWGVEIVPILGALGVAGIAVALALQPVLANIFSGVSIILDKSTRVGDWIVLEDKTWGVIQRIGIRSTKIKTFDNDMIIMPNTKLAESQIRNVSLPEPKIRKIIPFGVAYGSNIEKVKKIVLAELKKVKYVVKDPTPHVKFLEMGDSSLNFKAFFYIETYENGYTAIDDANTKIYNALNKAGIEIPFPQMDVHMKKK